MRTCRYLLGLPRNYNGDGTYPCTASSQVLCDVITKEIRNAPNTDVLNRRYEIINTDLRLMLEREELSGPSYSRLKIFLRGEYENRRKTLRKEG